MPANIQFDEMRSMLLQKLADNLSADLFYHCVDHTIDVEMQAERIALEEMIQGEEDLLLLRTACLYHDCGFIFTYNDHEAAGNELAMKELPAYGYSPKQLTIITGLIMATRIPQLPQTKLEEVICDADLNYLGRNDFIPISNDLFLELKAKEMVQTEDQWNRIQVNFFRQHRYFTASAIKLRTPQKLIHLSMIEAMMERV